MLEVAAGCALGAVLTSLHPLAGLGAAACFVLTALAGRQPSVADRHEPEHRRQATAQQLGDTTNLDRARTAFDHLADAVLVFDGLGEVAFANPAAELLWSNDERTPAGASLRAATSEEIFAKEHLQPIGKSVREMLDGHASESVRYRAVPQRDRVLDLEMSLSGAGADASVICVAHDVTDRHDGARAKDAFLSSVSHELRTPLTNICSYTEILQSIDPSTSEWKEFLDVVNGESQRLSKQLQSLLDYARIRAGRVLWRRETVDLEQRVAELVQVFAARAEAAGLDLQIERAHSTGPSPQDLPHTRVLADGAWLFRALSEVVDNALKFTPRGGRITIRIEPGVSRHRIDVIDTGPGIPAAETSSIFDELVQSGDILTDKPKGIGLGLSLARAAIQGFGGELTCEPSTDGGHFRCDLPVAGDHQRVEPGAAPV